MKYWIILLKLYKHETCSPFCFIPIILFAFRFSSFSALPLSPVIYLVFPVIHSGVSVKNWRLRTFCFVCVLEKCVFMDGWIDVPSIEMPYRRVHLEALLLLLADNL